VGFVRYERKGYKRGSPRDRDTEPFLTLSKGFAKLHFNWVAIKTLIEPRGYFVQLFFDEDNDRIGMFFEKYRSNHNSKITPSGKDGNGGSVNCKDFIENFNIDRIFKKRKGSRFLLQEGTSLNFFYVQLERE
jgi:hypothetical protein